MFWEPRPSFQAWLRIGADLCQVCMNSRRFHQAGMKKCQVGTEEMEVELKQEAMQEFRIFAMA